MKPIKPPAFLEKLQQIEIQTRAKASALRWFSWVSCLLLSAGLATSGYAFYIAAVTGIGIAFFPPLALLVVLIVGVVAGLIGYKLGKINAEKKLKKTIVPLTRVAKQEKISKNAAWRWFLRPMLIVVGLWIGAGFPLMLLGIGLKCVGGMACSFLRTVRIENVLFDMIFQRLKTPLN